MDLLKGLNEEQKEAVLATEGYVRVIAGAGSGKTKLLVSRYAYLVRDYGIDSANILCVTFTNKAAGEMKRRIRELIGPTYDTNLICTYHGFCARLLREDPEKLFLHKGFQIMDGAAQRAILEEIFQKYELKLDHSSFEKILKRIGEVKSGGAYVPRMCDPAPGNIMQHIAGMDDQITEDFLQRQKALCVLDFHDLLHYALYLLERDEEVRGKWQERLNYIMVDEFQDSSRREMKLVDLLSDRYRNLMIVGDPDQNIYEWRGSDVKLLVDFDKTHKGTKTVFLNRNYRSTPQILRCANVLIDKNEIRLKKDLYTASPAGTEVNHYHAKSDEEENEIIAETVKAFVGTGRYRYSDCAILYRSSFLSRMVEKKLVEAGIPYEIYGGVRFYQRMEVQDMIAYLRLIAYDDDTAFKRIVNTPRRKFGRAKMAALERIRDSGLSFFSEEGERSLFQALKENLSDPALRSSEVTGLLSLVEEMREKCGRMRISEIVKEVAVKSGYMRYIRELGDEERLENLMEFMRIASEFEASFGEDLSLSEFLCQIALQSAEGEEKERQAVKLMTIHAAKGLEFPIVFIVGLSEGVFPSAKSIEDRKRLGLEEERRLCYVAITRAKEHLFLMDSEGLSQNGMKKLPSRFLFEIGAKNYTRVGTIDEELARESRRYSSRLDLHLEENEERTVGDTVSHHVFGEGRIVSIDEKRGSYVVAFNGMERPRYISQSYFRDLPAEEEPLPVEEETASVHEEAPSEPPPVFVYPWEKHLRKDQNGQKKDVPVYVARDGRVAQNADDEDEEELPDEEDWQEDDDDFEIFVEEESFTVSEAFRDAKSFFADGTPDRAQVDKRLQGAREALRRSPLLEKGWQCLGVTDLGSPCGVCEACGRQIIRYVHHMHNALDGRTLDAGCVCAGRLEGNIDGARLREREFKRAGGRYSQQEPWNGVYGAPMRSHRITLYRCEGKEGWWYSVDDDDDNPPCATREEAIEKAFRLLERIRKPKKR